MLERHFTEPRHMQSDILFDRARVVIRIEPDGQANKAIEVEVGTVTGMVRFDFEDMELHRESLLGNIKSPVAVYPTRRRVLMEIEATGEPTVRVPG